MYNGHWRNQTALAVTNHPQSRGIDTFDVCKRAKFHYCIAHEIISDRCGVRTRRSTDAAIVATKHGDATPRQRIGQD